MKKILEYMTIAMSVLGTLCMIGDYRFYRS